MADPGSRANNGQVKQAPTRLAAIIHSGDRSGNGSWRNDGLNCSTGAATCDLAQLAQGLGATTGVVDFPTKREARTTLYMTQSHSVGT